ncbi:MAG: glycogen debranching enzyme N-terminal domain-containing protein, partial [Gemmatirosa sp.]
MPSVHFRSHDAHVSTPLPEPFTLKSIGDRHELTASNDLPPLRMFLHGERTAFTVERKLVPELIYRIEEARGYESSGDLLSP